MTDSIDPAHFKPTPEDDPLRTLRDEFEIPTCRNIGATAVPADRADEPCVYLAGNSLGLLPKRARKLVQEELDVWGTLGVQGHFEGHPHGRPWLYAGDAVVPALAKLVGAHESEVAAMGTLTANLHVLLNTFYKPTAERFKIICEARPFPSDIYALASQACAHGRTPADALVLLAPRAGEHALRTADILEAIAAHGPQLALVLLPGVQYYTGQAFRMREITDATRAQGAVAGWDLAHAVGNVPLALHDWGVDFAVWCSYKYLNAGPGATAGLFLHERWADLPVREAGWWGHDLATRFDMPNEFVAIRGARGLQQSNPAVLPAVSLLGSLLVFEAAGGVGPLRARSERLTGYLEALLRRSRFWVPIAAAESHGGALGLTVITPEDAQDRGAQLSLVVLPTGRGIMPRVFRKLEERGVVGDSRKPDVIRFSPVPLYNSFEDVERAVARLEEVLEEVEKEGLDIETTQGQ